MKRWYKENEIKLPKLPHIKFHIKHQNKNNNRK